MATTDSFCSNLDIKRKLVEESYCRHKFSFRFFALSSQSDANTYLTISVKMRVSRQHKDVNHIFPV